jgi:hypothetical protein
MTPDSFLAAKSHVIHTVTNGENAPVWFPTDPDWLRFQDLRSQWLAERSATSSSMELCMVWPYLQIVAMGPKAIPLILAQLRGEGDEPDHWWIALRLLTDANPVPEEFAGQIVKMKEYWLKWGESHV